MGVHPKRHLSSTQSNRIQGIQVSKYSVFFQRPINVLPFDYYLFDLTYPLGNPSR